MAKIYHSILLSVSFVLLFQVQHVMSQAPGYMGKKFNVYYGYNFSPAFTGANYNDRYWNQLHEFSLQYAYRERWQVGLSTRLYNALYDNKRTIASESQAPANNYQVKGKSVLLTFRHFKNGYVAPWGRYFDFGLVMNFTTAHYDSYMHIRKLTHGHDTLISAFGPTDQKYQSVDFIMGWGRTRIFKDRFIVDWGWNTCLLALAGFLTDELRILTTDYTYDNYIDLTHRERVHGLNRFNIYLRLGYLF